MSETETDVDEPPTKISKIQDEKSIEEEHLEAEEEDEMGEGQEEWLSEGILTDDDYNPGTEQETLDPSLTSACENSQTSQDDETPSLDDSTEQQTVTEGKSWTTRVEIAVNDKVLSDITPGMTDENEAHSLLDQEQKNEDHQTVSSTTKNDVQNIEEALNSFEAKSDLADVLETFLIRKPDPKIEVEEEERNDNEAVEQQNDDGNDTDELLRLLGDDDNKLKKKVLVKKSNKRGDIKQEDSSDDEFSYENAASVKTLRVARNVLMKGRPASKAVPEDLSDGGNYNASSDEASTVKNIFGVPVKKNTVNLPPGNQTKSLVKHVVHLNRPTSTSSKPVSTTTKQYVNKNIQNKSVSNSVAVTKPAIINKVEGKPTTVFKSETSVKSTTLFTDIGSKTKSDLQQKSLKSDVKLDILKPTVKLEALRTETLKSSVKNEDSGRQQQESDEIIDEEEFLEEDEDFELDEEEFGEESDMEEGTRKQPLMRPERMDEEVPSDAESHTEDGSLYDEIPSSDSEDLDDWFTLDIRSERAGDYLPLLGPRARELLLEEKKRVAVRLATLRQSLSALTESGRKQAEQLRTATMSLAELDDMLKAT